MWVHSVYPYNLDSIPISRDMRNFPAIAQETETPFLYCKMAHADHLELLFDEVLLNANASRCFQARRRMSSVVRFEKGHDQVDASAFATSIERVAALLLQPARTSSRPSAVLHGYAVRDEVDNEDAVRALSERRGIPAFQAGSGRIVDRPSRPVLALE